MEGYVHVDKEDGEPAGLILKTPILHSKSMLHYRNSRRRVIGKQA